MVCCFVHRVREGLSNQMLIEPTPEGDEGASRVGIWGSDTEGTVLVGAFEDSKAAGVARTELGR